jgi:hypothetical protein
MGDLLCRGSRLLCPPGICCHNRSVRSAGFEPAASSISGWPLYQVGVRAHGAAARCRPGPPAVRRRSRSRARRHRCPPWIRTTINASRARRPAGWTNGHCTKSTLRRGGGIRTHTVRYLKPPRLPVARLPHVACAARDSNSVPRGKSPVHHQSCLQRSKSRTGELNPDDQFGRLAS